MTTVFNSFVSEIEQMTFKIKNVAESVVQRELIDPIEMYTKHYQQKSNELLQICEQTWLKMHSERQLMLLYREEYCNRMFEIEQLK